VWYGNETAREARRLQSIECVIVVNFTIKDARIGNLGIVDLDFVGSSKSPPRPGHEQDRDDSGKSSDLTCFQRMHRN